MPVFINDGATSPMETEQVYYQDPPMGRLKVHQVHERDVKHVKTDAAHVVQEISDERQPPAQEEVIRKEPAKKAPETKRKVARNQPNKAPQNTANKAPEKPKQKTAPFKTQEKAAQKKETPKQPEKSPQKQPPKELQIQEKKVPQKRIEKMTALKVVDPKQLINLDPKSGCVKKILILGGMKIVEQWAELEDLVRILKQYPNENNVTFRMPLECPTQKCTIELTFSANFSGQMTGKDAVILGVAPYTLLTNMPSLLKTNQPDDQLWMLYGVETALRIHKWIKTIGDLKIHAMWSYLSTSSIHMPYAFYQPGAPVMDKVRKTNKFWTENKTKLVGWMGSNCAKEVFWPRMDFILDLQQHVELDTYGKCGNLTCLPRLSEECKNVMTKYKFYLSVENAECNEYMSEKIWDTALQHGVVPIVYGARKEDYIRLAPPNSFIYVGDFNSTKALADYIKKLDRRPDLYAKYFEWRYKGSVKQVYPNLDMNRFCDVIPFVDQLKKGKIEKRPVSTFPWYNTCRNPITKIFNIKRDVPPLKDWTPW